MLLRLFYALTARENRAAAKDRGRPTLISTFSAYKSYIKAFALVMHNTTLFDWLTKLAPLKQRPNERFFARAGDAIFSNFVASPAREGGYTSDKF